MSRKLVSEIELNVRFSETDAMGVVWHGNYLKFFEDGREAFGVEYQIPYMKVYQQGYYIPIVNTSLNFKSPVRFGEKVKVVTTFNPVRSAKLLFDYVVINCTSGQIAATGSTTQVFTDAATGELQLIAPAFYKEWLEQHQIQL